MTQTPSPWNSGAADPAVPPVPAKAPPGGWGASNLQPSSDLTLAPGQLPPPFPGQPYPGQQMFPGPPGGAAPYPPGSYGPPPPSSRKGAMIGFSLLGVLILLVVLAVVGGLYERGRYTPQKSVASVFRDLQSGSVSAVQNDSLVPPVTGPLLTDVVLKRAVAGSHPLHNVSIGHIITHGDTGTAVVNFDLGSVHQTITVAIARDTAHSHFGLFHAWKAVSLLGGINADGILAGVPNATVNGVAVSSVEQALPGWYDVAFADPNGLLQAAATGSAVEPDQDVTVRPAGATTVTAAGQAKIISGLTSTLAMCAASTDPTPFDCPFGIPADSVADASGVTYTAMGDPTGGAKVTGYDASTEMATVGGTFVVTAKWMALNEDDGSENPRTAVLTSTYTATVQVGDSGVGDYFDFGAQTG